MPLNCCRPRGFRGGVLNRLRGGLQALTLSPFTSGSLPSQRGAARPMCGPRWSRRADHVGLRGRVVRPTEPRGNRQARSSGAGAARRRRRKRGRAGRVSASACACGAGRREPRQYRRPSSKSPVCCRRAGHRPARHRHRRSGERRRSRRRGHRGRRRRKRFRLASPPRPVLRYLKTRRRLRAPRLIPLNLRRWST